MKNNPAMRRYLDENELARRWNVSVKLLQKQRAQGDGVPFSKFGAKVRYRLRDIQAYEREHRFTSTSAVNLQPSGDAIG